MVQTHSNETVPTDFTPLLMRLLILLTALLFCHHTGASAQTTANKRTITGRVTDAKTGEPLPAVAIVVQGTSNGTTTDLDGHYSISILKTRQVLVVSSVGYDVQRVTVPVDTLVVNIVLKESANQLQEVVVVSGYSSQRKSSMAYAVTTVSGKDIQDAGGKKSGTWKRSGLPENSIRLEIGDNDYLPLEAAQMAVQVDGFRVRVLMDCFFYNDRKERLEGTFKLRLPAGASPYYFAFGETAYMINAEQNATKQKIPFAAYTAGAFQLSPDNVNADDQFRKWRNVKEARIVSKQKAARAYEQTVNARIDPALMEWAGADMFSCRVFPLSKGKLHRIVIGYDLNMTEAASFREYTLSIPEVEKEFKLDADLSASPGMMPEILPATATTQNGNRIYFSVSNPSKKEFTIRYNTVAPILLSNQKADYFAANYRISLPETLQPALPEDAVFLLDVSLSSNPDKFNVWLKLMEEILSKNKDVIKRFSVLCFNIETYWWDKHYIHNNYYNIDQFLHHADSLALEGATDLGEALAEAENPSWLKPEDNRPKHIFVMSDADANWGESNMQALKKMIRPGDRIHTYKTGLAGTNAALLDMLSKESGGFAFTVTGEEEAALTATSFRYRPWTIEKIEVEGVTDFLISGQPAQLYNGQKLIFSGRGRPTGNIRIQVNNGLERKQLLLSAQETITSNLTERIYGQLALGALESYGYQTEEATESYATYFRIPNATMSFLMLDNESDYRRFGIEDNDASYYVSNNQVEKIITALLQAAGSLLPAANGKTDFIAWLQQLQKNNDVAFTPDSLFMQYVQSLPEELFQFKQPPLQYETRYSNDQTDEEKDMLANENLLYDDLTKLAAIRNKEKSAADALKLLSSVIERNPADFTALRDLAIKAIDWNMGDQAFGMMRRIISNRQYEAVAYFTAAQALAKAGKVEMALIYYYLCTHANWSAKYGSFREISSLQLNRYIDALQHKKATTNKSNKTSTINYSDTTLHYMNMLQQQTVDYLKNQKLYIDEADVVIVINWNTDNTDVDLHVTEPSGEECYYSHRDTKSGGQLSIDVTEGYGPEMYVLKQAPAGAYKVDLNYFADNATKTASKSKVYVDFYRNWGRSNETVTHKAIILEQRKENMNVFKFQVRKSIDEK